MHTLLKSSVLLMLLSSNMAFAGLMVANDLSGGGYTMTDFAAPTGSNATSATSMNGDIVNFATINSGSAASMLVGDNTQTGQSWWSGVDSDFYYADFGTTWLELIMPSNTVSFSLSIDANVSSSAWIVGMADDGSAIDTSGNTFTTKNNGHFNPNDPAFTIPLGGNAKSYSFYADNTSGTCNTISKVIVDPHYWGMGDFSISVDDNACQVPEPSIIALFAVGLIGLGFARRSRA